jgi:hypothetical protein
MRAGKLKKNVIGIFRFVTEIEFFQLIFVVVVVLGVESRVT